jgi:phosphoribosyl 1,2-cyclic phosphate phosphodiesterase
MVNAACSHPRSWYVAANVAGLGVCGGIGRILAGRAADQTPGRAPDSPAPCQPGGNLPPCNRLGVHCEIDPARPADGPAGNRVPLPHSLHTRDISGRLIVLGTGTSVGVPAIGCGCAVCTSDDPRNRRTRCAVVLGLPEGNLLIDTPPDLRTQLLREGVGIVHAVAFTHEHADHLFGLDDLRLFPFYLGHAVPLYCEERVEDRIRRSFDYAFSDHPLTHGGAVPQLAFVRIADEPFHVLGARVAPIRLRHGPNLEVLGFRVGNVAYCTDVNGVPEASWPLLEGLDVLILDALRHRPHVTHFSLDQAIEVARRVRPKRTLFTHISHELEHAGTNARLPAGMELAYDGQAVPLT